MAKDKPLEAKNSGEAAPVRLAAPGGSLDDQVLHADDVNALNWPVAVVQRDLVQTLAAWGQRESQEVTSRFVLPTLREGCFARVGRSVLDAYDSSLSCQKLILAGASRDLDRGKPLRLPRQCQGDWLVWQCCSWMAATSDEASLLRGCA